MKILRLQHYKYLVLNCIGEIELVLREVEL